MREIMTKDNNKHFTCESIETKAIHAGRINDEQFGSLATPLYQTSTFIFDNAQQGADRFAGESEGFIYGLPELKREQIKSANKIANPGCFATSIQLALLPLAMAGQLKDDVHVSAVTGSTGAGQSLSATGHFSWRNNNISIYKAFTHQHLGELHQSIKQLQNNFNFDVNFIDTPPIFLL